ncbi:MAG: zinc ribbon domain-containing protein [Promethearchaeota archaeon]
MVNWNEIADQTFMHWQEFLQWFLSVPIYGQVLVVVGAVAILILAVVVVYYVLKGVAYLIYYVLKGVYLLLKAIFLGLYKLFEELYYSVSGKPRPVKKEKEPESEHDISIAQVQEPQIETPPVIKQMSPIQPDAAYCSECGNQITEQMQQKLQENGNVFCVYCGKGYKYNVLEIKH